jgi:hypothetical protein
MIINQLLIVEVKAAKGLANEHYAQLLGYLRSARMEHGVLVNFGAARFEIRKLIMPEGGYRRAELVLKPGDNDNPNHP